MPLASLGLNVDASPLGVGDTLVFGLDVGHTGHVAFEDSEELAFDVQFTIPPDTPRTES